MRCPQCEFVSSDKKDICPKCHLDLRPHKKQLGLPITNVVASFEQLEKALGKPATAQTVQTVPTAQSTAPPISAPPLDQTESSKSAKTAVAETLHKPKGMLSRVFGKKESLSEALPPANLQTSPPDLATESAPLTEAPNMQLTNRSLAGAGMEVVEEDLSLDDLMSQLNEAIAEQDSHNPLDVEVDTKEDKLGDIVSALQGGLEEATAATSLIAEEGFEDFEIEDVLSEPDEESPLLRASPSVTPDVLEFLEDDDLLEEQLDKIIGDLEFDIQAVKTENKPATKETTTQFSDGDDDFEISFEIELDEKDEQHSDNTAADKPSPAAAGSAQEDQTYQDLMATFDSFTAGSEQVSITSTTSDSQAESNEILSDLSLNMHTIDENAHTAKSGAEGQMLHELSVLLAEAYGIDPSVFAVEDTLKSLENELDAELWELMSEGTSFVQSVKPIASTAPQEEVKLSPEAEKLLKLQDELDSELRLLADEGTTVFGDTSEDPISATQADNDQYAINLEDDDLLRAEQELFSELSALEEADLIPAQSAPGITVRNDEVSKPPASEVEATIPIEKKSN